MSSYAEGLAAIRPELVLTVVAFAALTMDLIKKGRDSKHVGYLTLAGLFVTGWILTGRADGDPVTVLGMVVIDKFGDFFKLFTVGALAVVVLFIMNDRRERKHGVGEYYFLLLGAAIGIFFMVSTNNLLLMILGLELLSLASYSLAGFHKGDKRSGEAAMKYVIFGGVSTAVMLYGISLLFGLTGTLDLTVMGAGGPDGLPRGLSGQLAADPIPVAIAVVLVLAGFAYKVSVAPFHFWTPDVYEGAPTPVTTFLAVASKAAGFGVMLRFVAALFMRDGIPELVAQYGDRIGLLIGILAAITMTLGNLSALRQASIKRMLAYSSIAHAGYVLIGLAPMTETGFTASMYYLAAYYFMNLGAFGFLLYFQGMTGADTYESIRGLGWKAPVVSWTMVVFLVSLTGLPPTVGFYGKYLLFYEGVQGGYTWLVLVAALNSVVSLFYYLRVGWALFLASPTHRSEQVEIQSQPFLTGLLAVLGLLTVLFGIYTSPLSDWARGSLDILAAL